MWLKLLRPVGTGVLEKLIDEVINYFSSV